MPRTYIVGYDGSEAATAAIRFASMLATSDGGGEVVAANVYARVPYTFAPGASSLADAEIAEEVRREAVALLDGLDLAGARTVAVAADSAAQGLHVLAEQERAAAIVVGVTHRAALGRLLVGGVGDRLLHGAPCPVVIVPAGWAGQGLERVGVAYDGRPESVVALRAAEALALRHGARVLLIGVYDPAPYLWLTSAPPAPNVWDVPELRHAFADRVHAVADGLHPAVRGDARCLTGLPGPTLVDASHDVDVLVTGSRGYGPPGSVVLGSVARYVADHAVCPLLAVPRGTGGRTREGTGATPRRAGDPRRSPREEPRHAAPSG